MENDSPILFVEINKFEIIFIVSQKDDGENYEILFKDRIANENIIDFTYTDYNLIHTLLKKKFILLNRN